MDCDGSDDTVNPFVKQKEMPWPQLHKESQSQSEPWHPLAKQWGVNGIPTMFLVDKKGVLRFIERAGRYRQEDREFAGGIGLEKPADGLHSAIHSAVRRLVGLAGNADQ